MYLVIDAGNSTIAFAIMEENVKVRHFFKEEKFELTTYEKIKAYLLSNFLNFKIDVKAIEDVYLSCVTPSIIPLLSKTIKAIFSKELKTVKVGSSSLIKGIMPDEMGEDIYSNIVAVRAKYPNENVMVVDFGTASVIALINKNGELLGASIAPGVLTSIKTLNVVTEKISTDFYQKDSVEFGFDTKSAIFSGCIFSACGMIEKALKHYEEKLNEKIRVVATGGMSGVVSKFCDVIDSCDEHNTVYGIYLCCHE